MIKEVAYSYFVAWAYTSKDYPEMSVGNSILPLPERIRTQEQLRRLEYSIKTATVNDRPDLNIDQVCVTNITYLGEVEE